MEHHLLGIHHVTAITSSAEKVYDFFTYVLGLRLVKKTINQDDIHTYHLFFADDKGSAGTDMTFFDFKGIQKGMHGNNEITRTSFRVPNDAAIDYFVKRFIHYKVNHQPVKEVFGKKVLEFEDFDGQLYALYSDEKNVGIKSGTPWLKGPVPNEFSITGLGPIYLTVKNLELMDYVLVDILGMRKTGKESNLHLYEMGEGGNGGSVILVHNSLIIDGYQGYGTVHHVAFRVSDTNALKSWITKLTSLKIPHSGYVDRFYFESLYSRIYPQILFEFATDGPGFIDDEESYEVLGEKLALPPRFRNHRDYVEKIVRPIDTVRSTKVFEKEYF